MKTHDLELKLEQALAELPVLDAHTHLVGGKLGARGLHDVLLYHMLASDLYPAGCPSGARLTQYPDWPTREEAHQRIQEALPFLPLIRNTSTFWGLRLILSDLYDWREPITAHNWRKLDAIIRERADDRAWHHGILDRLSIQRTVTEIARREKGEDSGQPLDAYTHAAVFAPLGMRDTGFLPAERVRPRIAPTERCEEMDQWPCKRPGALPLRGVVHDPTARRMGGVAGHAGLFGTAQDLSRFARMLLGGGALDGVRVL